MDITTTSRDFVQMMGDLLRAEVKIEDDKAHFDIRGRLQVELLISSIDKVLTDIASKNEKNGTALFDDNCYEILVRDEAPRLPLARFGRLGRKGDFCVVDTDNGLSYTLSSPSKEYLVFLLCKVSDLGPMKYLARPMVNTHQMEMLKESGETIDIFHLANLAVGRLMTLKIESQKKHSANEFESFSNSFFFQISYNLDHALVPQRYFDELLRTGRITRLRRIKYEEIDAPKRIYTPDLIYHYQLAVASENPALEFLSYYHVAEHFFESVFNDALIEKVRQIITQPNFSYKRKKDISSLIRMVGKSISYQKDTISFSEQEALKLILERYIDFPELSKQLSEYDDSLIEYYKSKKVQFSDGEPVDLTSDDVQKIVNKLAQRIYKTRNSIVHSKDNEKGKFTPFEDDKMLGREIPLMRLIAEMIIINTSNLMA